MTNTNTWHKVLRTTMNCPKKAETRLIEVKFNNGLISSKPRKGCEFSWDAPSYHSARIVAWRFVGENSSPVPEKTNAPEWYAKNKAVVDALLADKDAQLQYKRVIGSAIWHKVEPKCIDSSEDNRICFLMKYPDTFFRVVKKKTKVTYKRVKQVTEVELVLATNR